MALLSRAAAGRVRIGDKLPVKLSERAVESNVLRRLAHCLEERCGIQRNDILFQLPTQREEKRLGYDAMVVGVWVALQFKRAECVRSDGVARFSIDLGQAKTLQGLLPRGCAFYALTPIAKLDPFIASLPRILDESYLVDVHDILGGQLGRDPFSLWVAKDGEARVCNGGKKRRTVPSLKTSVLCCPGEKPGTRVGFSVDEGGRISYRVKPSNGGGGTVLEPWPHRVYYIARQLGRATALRMSTTHLRGRH